MPYSMDSNENKGNAASPSVWTLTEQLLYKIAALDSSVQSGFRRIDEKMDRFQSDLHESQIAVNDRINNLDREISEVLVRKRQRIDGLEKEIHENARACEERSRINFEAVNDRIREVEVWQKVLTARFTLIGAAALALWTFISPIVRHAVGLGE